jgi:hypothetical protein
MFLAAIWRTGIGPDGLVWITVVLSRIAAELARDRTSTPTSALHHFRDALGLPVCAAPMMASARSG